MCTSILNLKTGGTKANLILLELPTIYIFILSNGKIYINSDGEAIKVSPKV